MDKHSVRKNIQRSQKRNVEVYEMQSSDLPYYFEMIKETKQKEGSKVKYEDFENLWNLLSSVGMTGFVAYKEKQLVGGILISSFNGLINEWGVARSKFDTEKKLYSQDYIKWKIIEWGIGKGCKYFDLTGVNPNPKSSKEKGILRFKKKFGGKMAEYNVIKL
jgi:lipid II:glycine glycyltransferase (peptidoglycan interpeptide bridge formation enzyme)